ncbi:MAG: 3-deoxy-D-manno-octulosonic acid kinase [Bacteroidetes bacterium]|nr:3-deoxy-D-manno-octulosonic acid kinase [Bacteroidota bacterium]
MKVHHPIIKQDSSIQHPLMERDFDFHHWSQVEGTQLLAGGRGASQKLYLEGQAYVLRQYRRGGMLENVLVDKYFWTGLSGCRPSLEAKVVEYAVEKGLPVAPIVAYAIKRDGLFYRASILTRFVENIGTLATVLRKKVLADNQWKKLGGVIRQFHKAGIYHADLNADNILLDKVGNIYLIDFDKGKLMNSEGKWCDANLKRLLRSLHKIQGKQSLKGKDFHFSEMDWQNFNSGYKETNFDK